MAHAEELYNLPDDFKGGYTRQYVQEKAENTALVPDLGLRLSIIMEIGNYINEKYPGDELYDDKILPELRRFFPQDTNAEFNDHVIFLRNALMAYRKTREYIQKKISEKLVPATPREVHSEDDFDHPGEVPYIEAQPGHYTKVYNFKKFLTYSEDGEETAAITKYKIKMNNAQTWIDKVNELAAKIEWKKVLFYGTKYKNPLLTDLGVGPMMIGNKVKARLLSRQTYIHDKTELDIGLQLITELGYYILANNISPLLNKPQIDLKGSENVADWQIFYPTPLNSPEAPYAHKYFGDFLIPVKIIPQDPTQPVKLKLVAKLFVCNDAVRCTPEYFETELEILPAGPDLRDNGYENFFYKNISALPQKDGRKYHLNKIVVDDNKDRQGLRLEFKTETKVKNFKVFVEEKDGYTRFLPPLINIQDNKIYVRFLPVDEDKNNDLVNSEFEVTAVMNTHDSLRTTKLAQKASIFDTEAPKLNWGLIFFAVLGGLILNFMPCVFPMLSLKVMALSQATTRRSKQIKKAVRQTIYGIFFGFTLIILLLLIAKYLGYSLGWGMQFQNMSFLIVMTFVLASFTAVFPQIDFDGLYRYTITRPNSRINFLIGSLIVLLSTPCTGPYLATAIGFALTGNYWDIVCILYAVALGLSLPYLLILSLDKPETLFPKPGPWLNKLHLFMQIMLYLTILWFMWLIQGQTNWMTLIKLCFSVLIFTLLFRLYKAFLEYLDGIFEENITPQILARARRGATLIITIIFLVLCTWCSYDANSSYKQKEQQNQNIKQTVINIDEINEKLRQGKSVLVEIGADWCMTCQVNNILALTPTRLRLWAESYNLEVVKVDWTNYNRQTLDFMEKYGRKGLPFYILYTPLLRDGIVLPELFASEDIENMLLHINQR